jgi:hypothetical protein
MLPENYAVVKDQVAWCGIRCGECALGNGSVGEAALNLSKYLKQYDVPSWASETPDGKDVDFNQFDRNLLWVQRSLKCPGCLNGGGSPACPIRLCAKEKRLSSCGQCADLESCAKFDWLGKKGEMLKAQLAGHQ